jgi:phenylpropionate dioxygenase-like ring-hydroxylating dioxygenase large terminal subunit
MNAVTNNTVTNETRALRRAWHCVAHTDEVDTTPVQVWLLGEPWVLVRLGPGKALRAFVDRCPHRSAPLSIGTVVGDELQCAYHGWRYAESGACTAIPALGDAATIPSRACLITPFAVEERFGLVFLAPEEPRSPLPAVDFLGDDSFLVARCETVRTHVGAAQLVDNFMDAAHFPFVHPDSFGVEGEGAVVSSEVIAEGWSVTSTFDGPYQHHDDQLVDTGEHPLVQPHRVTKVGRADFIAELELRFELTGGTFRILYAVTPERADSTRIYKLIARDDLSHDPGRIEQVTKDEDKILGEDLAVLERFDDHALDVSSRYEISTRSDRLSVAWRRLLERSIRTVDETPAPTAIANSIATSIPTSIPTAAGDPR